MDTVNRIRKILDGRQLNINNVSRATLAVYGPASPFFIPHNFYHNIEVCNISPHLCQVFSLSKITNYRFAHWLAAFGFHLDEIPRLQMKLHSNQTVLITPVTYDKEAMVPWFEATDWPASIDQTIPLGRFAQQLRPHRVRTIESSNRKSFLYAKIGRHDGMAFPELVPGSIVRVDPRRTNVVPFYDSSTRARPFYLVQHTRGLSCCYVDKLGDNRILLRPHSLSYESIECHLPSEAVILGAVDVEIRPLQGIMTPDPSESRKTQRGSGLQKGVDPDCCLRDLVRTSRESTGLHLREAHEMSVEIAKELGDPTYAISIGSLSEYEAANTVPRHIHKSLSLCILYCINFWRYLRAANLSLDEGGKDPIPPADSRGEMKSSGGPPTAETSSAEDKFIAHLFDVVEEVPLFLRKSLKDIFRSPDLSWGDVCWIGRKQKIFHPLLRGGLLVIVNANRRMNKIADQGWKGLWERPLYLVLKRDGQYACGFCSLKGGILTVHPHPEINIGVERFRYEQDAEVVGQVIGIVRLIS